MSNPIPIPSSRRRRSDSPRDDDYGADGEGGSSGGSGRSDDLFQMDSSDDINISPPTEQRSPTNRDFVYEHALTPSPQLQRHLERARPRASTGTGTQPVAGAPPSRTGGGLPSTAPGSAFLTPSYPTNVSGMSGSASAATSRGGYPASYRDNAPQPGEPRALTQYGFPRYQPQSLTQAASMPNRPSAGAVPVHWQPSPGNVAPPIVHPSSSQYYPGQYPASQGHRPPPHASAQPGSQSQSLSAHRPGGPSRAPPESYYPYPGSLVQSQSQTQSDYKERQTRRRHRDG